MFLTNCQTLNVYPKFLTFNLPNVTSHDARFIRKRQLHSAIKKRKKQLSSLRKDAAVYEWTMRLRKMFINVLLKPLRHMRKS